jgi:hypothetical protein
MVYIIRSTNDVRSSEKTTLNITYNSPGSLLNDKMRHLSCFVTMGVGRGGEGRDDESRY